MSLRYEQHWALRKTRNLLHDLLDPVKRPKTAAALKQRALDCLRHFPPLMEDGTPMWSNDDWQPPRSAA